MIITPKKELLIKLFCITILLTLIILIYLNGKNLDASKCLIKLQATKVDWLEGQSKPIMNGQVTILELYGFLKNNTCTLKYDDDWGFYYDYPSK